VKAPSLGEAAVDLAWIAPSAASLLALARGPDLPEWMTLRSDPGFLLLLSRFPSQAAENQAPLLSPESCRDPSLLEASLRLLQSSPPALVPWGARGPDKVYRTCLAHARLAFLLANKVGCEPEKAWAGALLAPLGWLACCSIDPEQTIACLQYPDFSNNPAALQRRLWGLDQTAIARRLSRRWGLRPWLATVAGQLGLPFQVAKNLGADKELFSVIQLAVGLNQQHDPGLRLPVGAAIPELLSALQISTDAVDECLEELDRSSQDLAGADSWQTPEGVPLLSDLLAMALTNRRRSDQALVEQLHDALENVQSALEEQCGGERARLEAMKVAALAEMAAGAGHEINNPLAVISGQAQYLLAGESDPERGRSLQAIIRQAQRIHQILHDLMQFARPAPPQKRAVEVGPLVRDVVISLQDLALEKQVRLETPEPLPSLVVDADPGQTRTILCCLLRNAIEAAPLNGWAALRAEQLGPATAVFVVEDNGQGPSPTARAHLFDPFFSGRTAGRGRGLGLPTAWRLARQQGGEVRFEPSTNGITRFVLTLPLADFAHQQPSSTNQDSGHNGSNGCHRPATSVANL
jgi:two-component system NtrC family sensor kinase